MNNLVIHPTTKLHITGFLSSPSHALTLVAPAGSGKFSLALVLASEMLAIDNDKIMNFAYLRLIRPEDNKAIGIDAIRDIEQFLSLKVPNSQLINRVVIVENANLMTLEAQTALLKTLEEPPSGTVIILTAFNEQDLIATIRSRSIKLYVAKPEINQVKDHFSDLEFASETIDQALSVSGGLPGLTAAILQNDQDHPLLQAVVKAKSILSGSRYSKMLLVDELSKDKLLAFNVLSIIQQMAQISLLRSTSNTGQWQKILDNSYQAQTALVKNAQSKLVLSKYMLDF